MEDGRSINNERLEYLGDAVIEAVTSDYIFIEYPDRDEGFMTQLRSKIVSRQSLNALAERLGLDQQVIATHGRAFRRSISTEMPSEAMMGAIYLDQGGTISSIGCSSTVSMPALLDLEALTRSETDFKSRLIEWCQKKSLPGAFPDGTQEGCVGSNHPVFYCTVLVDGMEVGHGIGDSKEEAEQHAAFSVSQYMTDEQCASLLDRMDPADPPVGRSLIRRCGFMPRIRRP